MSARHRNLTLIGIVSADGILTRVADVKVTHL